MSKELKIIFIFIFLLPILGFVMLVVKDSSPYPVLSNISGLESAPTSYTLGNVPRLGGLITKEYIVKNTTDKSMKLKKITTSCMCTKAKVIIRNIETPYFSLEHNGDKNAPINIVINPGQEAKVIVQFDPNAHGPQGLGYLDRSIQLMFSNPVAVKELTFNVTVVEK